MYLEEIQKKYYKFKKKEKVLLFNQDQITGS